MKDMEGQIAVLTSELGKERAVAATLQSRVTNYEAEQLASQRELLATRTELQKAQGRINRTESELAEFASMRHKFQPGSSGKTAAALEQELVAVQQQLAQLQLAFDSATATKNQALQQADTCTTALKKTQANLAASQAQESRLQAQVSLDRLGVFFVQDFGQRVFAAVIQSDIVLSHCYRSPS